MLLLKPTSVTKATSAPAPSWYVQGGPAFVSPDGEDTTTELSGKVGLDVAVTERLTAYGEIAAITSEEMDFDADLSVGAKVGVKFALLRLVSTTRELRLPFLLSYERSKRMLP